MSENKLFGIVIVIVIRTAIFQRQLLTLKVLVATIDALGHFETG